ncbi:MAG: hypothetical protein ACI3ZJ_05060 [Bacteroidaceae bacterium]
MKKYFLSMMSILMVAMLSVGLASCSKDDDNEKTNPEVVDDGDKEEDVNPLVGNWYSLDEDETYDVRNECLWIFNSDGTCKAYSHNVEGDYWDVRGSFEGRYVYYEDEGEILVTVTKQSNMDLEKGAQLYLDVLSISSSQLVISMLVDVGSEQFTCKRTSKTSL